MGFCSIKQNQNFKVLLNVSSSFSSDEWLWVLIFSSIAELHFLKSIKIIPQASLCFTNVKLSRRNQTVLFDIIYNSPLNSSQSFEMRLNVHKLQ